MQAKRYLITGAQMRAARAFLNWTMDDLAKESGVSVSAINRAERVDYVPSMQKRNLRAVQLAFEAHGLRFLDGNGLQRVV